ncbi:hypothetical protein Bca52824_047193 [Brassica carinata]|uniref:ABC transporter domain-containing protein n=1 Tax=Brassica carinata TaxID=52824 RepID=A0A8X7RLH4_BRACI|nr:hypothetical protein Bca52824_047193 [Brassica carinata]
MPRVAAESQEISLDGGWESPTLGELLKDLEDGHRKKDSGEDASVHHVLDVASPETRPVPFLLSFNNLCYDVRGKADSVKTLLNDVSGEVCDGDVLAVLGASGAGKSTLIDALAGRVSSLRGTVTLNGEKVLKSQLLKVISAYVMQDDLLFPMLTVKETLMFASEFRLPRSLSKSKKMERVEALIDKLGLRNAADTIIGDEGHRGVSGGERRRVSIGADIIHDPIVLFLDEPTSGLDSTNAFMVVQVLKRIARSGSMVIMSIHQPSARIIDLLDRLIILSRGKSVFSGYPTSLPQFLSDFGHPVPGKRTSQSLHLTYSTRSGNRRATPMTTPYKALSLKESITTSVSRGKLVSGSTSSKPISMETVSYANRPLLEIYILSKRYIKNWSRTPELIITRLATVLVTGLILATIYWRLDNTPRGAQERMAFFSFAMSTMFYTCADNLPVFIHERYIFLRETTHNAYRTYSYVISHVLVSLPQLLALSIAFAVTTFWTVGLSGGLESFLYYCVIIYAAFWSGSSFVTFISGLIPNVMISFMVTISYLSYCLLMGGFFINRDRIPGYWIWFHYISLMKYPYEAVLINEFDDPSRCFVRGVQVFDGTLFAKVPDAIKVKMFDTLGNSLGTKITESTCLRTGPDLLLQQGISQLSKWDCLWVTFAWGIFFRILFYLSLLFGSKNKRT